jgi:tetratricopeptide (TPR) repeat protein
MNKRKKAAQANDRAMQLREQGHLDEAIQLYHTAATLDPTWGAPLYNLGLLYKHQKQWAESLQYNQQATALEPTNEAAWWNLGIAATALGRWDVARAAWRGFGIKLPDGEGPIDLPCGYGPIRLNPDGDGEVVWAYRIDPARAELANIPLPESGHRWRDIVLTDGAPVGYRKYKGKDVPVFNALGVLEPSPFGTFVAEVTMPAKPQYIQQLAELAAKQEGSAEDWTTSTRILCKACSEGRPHATHDTEAAPADGVHLIGIAARDRQHATGILRAWESDLDDVEVKSLGDALAPGGDGQPSKS